MCVCTRVCACVGLCMCACVHVWEAWGVMGGLVVKHLSHDLSVVGSSSFQWQVFLLHAPHASFHWLTEARLGWELKWPYHHILVDHSPRALAVLPAGRQLAQLWEFVWWRGALCFRSIWSQSPRCDQVRATCHSVRVTRESCVCASAAVIA